jgi:AraC-like DNA-binding protein
VDPAVRLREIVAGGFFVTEASYAPGAVLATHAHAQPSLTFVLEGGFREEIGSRGVELRPRALLIKPGAAEHRDLIGRGGSTILFVEPSPARQAALVDALPLLSSTTLLEMEAVARLAGRIRSELHSADPLRGLLVEALLLEALCLAAREGTAPARYAPGWLRRIRDRLAAEFRAPPSVAALALDAGVSPTHASRAFHRHFGVSVTGFVHGRRVEWAADALAHSDRPLSQIALEAGFADQSHFGRTFLRHTGMTPGEYRRLARAPFRRGREPDYSFVSPSH